ncbi:MAG: sodium:proton antiporter [Actinomyces sp. oral taxon 181]|uniref:cation:proton antiporter n=1 Tax=Actinomyces sp. oral taxon 181 TaxID=712121 RepID=UPI0025C4D337|nr:sodium:proton antiporter [Actinomyces sp. oral taxon 181]MBS4796477.1 sodium:proton antiporter [Actinomyces sp. oral taxon 181]
MEPLMIALLGMLIIVATQFIAPKVGVASPLILLGVGLAIGFLPQVGAIEIAPHIILEIILPPLLFSAAVRMPTMDFRREMQAVAMLAIPLVFISSFAIGFLINWMVPQISLAWGVALGAVLSPTDAVAVTIAKRSGVSHRIITVLEGEGLFNDATSLVLLAAAMNAGLAADNDALNPALLTGRVLVALGIAIVVGLIVGEVGVRIRSIIKDSSTDTVFSFAMPFIASIPAEHVGGSGLVAAVVAGLVVSGRRAGMISAQNRRFSQQNWSTMTLMLESGIFLAMGLQAFGIIEDADGDGGGLARAAVIAVIAGSLIMVIRALFIAFMLTWLDHRRKHRKRRYHAEAERLEAFEHRMAQACVVDSEVLASRNLSEEQWLRTMNLWRRRLRIRERQHAVRRSDIDYFENEPLGQREGSVIVWAGMRGAITLAAAQTISSDAPMRSFLLTIALFIASGALVIQGLSLPWLIRLIKPKMASADISEEEREELRQVMSSALVDTALAQAIKEVDAQTLLSAGVSRTLSRLGNVVDLQSSPSLGTSSEPLPDTDGENEATPVEMSEEEVERSFTREQIRELALEAIHAQRDALLQARDEGIFSSSALEGALARLDNEEILLVSGQSNSH